MPKCYIMVGLPASGKSTFIGDFRLLHGSNYFVYSTDDVIDRVAKEKGLTYDEVFSDHIKQATKEANDGLHQAIVEGRDILWDQTNLTDKKRAKIMRTIGSGYQFFAVVAEPPVGLGEKAEWHGRLANRPGKTIPKPVLDSMLNSYVKPTFKEGFQEIIDITNWE